MLGRLRRGWRDLSAAPGLAAVRLFNLAELDPVLGGTPSPPRWALLCAWRSGAERDAFLADGERLRPLVLGARESCHLSLETVRTKDTWRGWSLPSEQRGRFAPEEPVLVMTHGRFLLRYTAAFTRHNQQIVDTELIGAPGLHAAFGIFDHPFNRATLSLWRSEQHVLDFAYRSAHHAEIQQRARRTPWARDFFFARFRPLGASGSWEGRDLLAGLGAD